MNRIYSKPRVSGSSPELSLILIKVLEHYALINPEGLSLNPDDRLISVTQNGIPFFGFPKNNIYSFQINSTKNNQIAK